MPRKGRSSWTRRKGVYKNKKAVLKKLESAALLLAESSEKQQVGTSGTSILAPKRQHFTDKFEGYGPSEKNAKCELNVEQKSNLSSSTMYVTVEDDFILAGQSSKGADKTEGRSQSKKIATYDVQIVQEAQTPSTPMDVCVVSSFFPANRNQATEESPDNDDGLLKLSPLAKKTDMASTEEGMVSADERNQDAANISREPSTVKTTSSREMNFFAKVVRRLEAFTSEIN